MILKKIWTAIMAIFNRGANAAVNADPVSVYRLKIDQATDRISKAQSSLSEFKGHVNRLTRQLEEDEKQVKLLDQQVDMLIKRNDDAAAGLADIKLQKATATRDSTKTQLDAFSKQYNAQVSMIKSSRQQILDAQDECRQMGLKLEMSKANKAAAELAADFAKDFENPMNEVSSIRDEISRQIDANNAVAEVNQDLGLTEPPINAEAELQAAAVTDRLAARKAKLGMPPTAPANG